MKRTIIFSLMLMEALGGAVSGAEANESPATAATKPVTLYALVAEALEQNPELKFYEAEILGAKAGRKTAGQLANPELSGSVGRKTARGEGLGAEGVAWSVSVVQPLEWPGRLGLRKAIANHDIELAELGYLRFKVALAGRVRTLAYETKLREMAKWRPDSVEHFREAAELADRHYRLGSVPIATCVELQQQYLEAVEGLLDTKRETLEAAAQLELLTGLPRRLANTSATEEKK